MAERLSARSLDWALRSHNALSDTDFFPRPFELEAITDQWQDVSANLRSVDIGSYQWSSSPRRCIVPKDRLGFRPATQLNPLDSIFLGAMVFQYGPLLEALRNKIPRDVVFSYRFAPQPDGLLFDTGTGWHEFWRRSLGISRSKGVAFVLVADISDFYNQIYHHTIENSLAQCGWPPEVVDSASAMCKSVTEKVSRGIPVGPHSTHLFAETTLHAVDQSIIAKGRPYCRYVDDMHIGCRSVADAQAALQELAMVLDKQQRLVLQRHKARIVPSPIFAKECAANTMDKPMNQAEDAVLSTIRKTAGRDPYAQVSLKGLTRTQLKTLGRDRLEDLLGAYLGEDEPNFARVNWLLRRLSQVGAPGAVDYLIAHVADLGPCVGDACKYLLSTRETYEGDWPMTASTVLAALNLPHVLPSEYVQAVLLDLFGRMPKLDHLPELLARYATGFPMVRRKIALAAICAGADYWVREQKEGWGALDPWLKRAVISGARVLPPDERRVWTNSVARRGDPLDAIVARWAGK